MQVTRTGDATSTRTPIWGMAGGLILGLALGVGLHAAYQHQTKLVRDHALRLQKQGRKHAQEIAALSAANIAVVQENGEFRQQITSLEFEASHATLELYEAQGELPDYDVEKFLRRNPRARKYFPFLTEAIKKYDDVWRVDSMFALAILKQESDFGRYVVSKAGALGDAQFIERTGRRYGLMSYEPVSWRKGRQNYRTAAEMRRQARTVRDDFLDKMARGLDSLEQTTSARTLLKQSFDSQVGLLAKYYELGKEAERLDALGNQAYEEYREEVNTVLSRIPELEREVRQRQQREEALIRTSAVRPPKSKFEREVEVRLVVNDLLAQFDPRLSPMLFVDALVHHLADLFREFKGDRRLVASRYNASRRAMEDAVANLGGGVGIPLLDETQNYVNRVVTIQTFLAVDSGILENNLGITSGMRFAQRYGASQPLSCSSRQFNCVNPQEVLAMHDETGATNEAKE